jgi:hypothetical protein
MFESKYYNRALAKKGDILTIKSNPVEVTGKFGVKPECEVELDGVTMKWGMNNTSGRKMRQAWGDPAKKSWVGKQVMVDLGEGAMGAFIMVEPIEELK